MNRNWGAFAFVMIIGTMGLLFGSIIHASKNTHPLTDTAEFINVCSQHPALCPVNEAHWTGELNGWQSTGKKWVYDINTPASINVMWEFSYPYTGPTTDYLGHRDNPYDDYTNTPDGYPEVPGAAPVTFEWERWDKDATTDNYRMYQYAGRSEQESVFVGQGDDCTSGTFYPVIDQQQPYSYSPMSVLRNGECVSGGYMAAQLIESWGTPRSPLRVAQCDSAVVGIPADQTPIGNAICKLSPYVGVVHQRYAWAAGTKPENGLGLGCEAAVYAWGWPEFESIDGTGQDYQAWFRNGELRLSRWINFTGETAVMPAPSDDNWWTSRCDRAWVEVTNWLYDGVYEVGDTIYTDTIGLPAVTSALIPMTGGVITVTLAGTQLDFAANTFTETAQVTHTIQLPYELPPTNGLVGLNYAFHVTAVAQNTQQPIQPTKPYSLTIQFSEADTIASLPDTTMLYYWNGTQWEPEPTTQINFTSQQIRAMPDRMGLWSLFFDSKQTFIPMIAKP